MKRLVIIICAISLLVSNSYSQVVSDTTSYQTLEENASRNCDLATRRGRACVVSGVSMWAVGTALTCMGIVNKVNANYDDLDAIMYNTPDGTAKRKRGGAYLGVGIPMMTAGIITFSIGGHKLGWKSGFGNSYYVGPRGGVYYYNSHGNKTYRSSYTPRYHYHRYNYHRY